MTSSQTKSILPATSIQASITSTELLSTCTLSPDRGGMKKEKNGKGFWFRVGRGGNADRVWQIHMAHIEIL